MKNKIFGVAWVLIALYLNVAQAGATVEVSLTTGENYTWQFMDMDEASEFLAAKIENGGCSPKVESVIIRSVYIKGLDDEELEFSWFHGIDKLEINL